MKTLLSAILFGLITALATNALHAAEDSKFDDKGLTFTYAKGWNIKTNAQKEVTTITADNKKGSTVTITMNELTVDPKTISSELDKTFKKIFEGKVVKDSDKAVKRKVLGAERDGQTLEIEIVKGVTTKLEYYAFKGSKKTISVTTTTTTIDPDGMKVVDAILESLAEKK